MYIYIYTHIANVFAGNWRNTVPRVLFRQRETH